MFNSWRKILVVPGVNLLCVYAFSQAVVGPLQRSGLYNGAMIQSTLDRPKAIDQEQTIPNHPAAPLPGNVVSPDSLGIAYQLYLWPPVNGVATVFYLIDAASDPNATSKIETAIGTFNSDFSKLIQWVP